MDCIASASNALQGEAVAGGPGEVRAGTLAIAGALVKNAKFAATIREAIDEKTGEIQRFRLDRRCNEWVLDSGPDFARVARFELQSASRRLLPDVRVAKCLRKLAGGSYVQVLKNIETERCHFGGLETCGSPWTCPVCAAKISERRKLEIRQAVDTHIAAGGGVEMLTLTVRHGRMDVLSTMMMQLRKALSGMREHRTYKRIRQEFGVIGSIRALEVTHGNANGWHPHFHELWLFSAPLSIRQRMSLRSQLFQIWQRSSVSAGLPAPSSKRGVHIQPAKSAAEYIGKWGTEPRWEIGSELAKANAKRSLSNKKGKTPFDLLRDYSENQDKHAGALFREFAKAFKGFNQVRWSRGLKAAFGVVENSDEEIAAQQDQPAERVVRVRRPQWRLVLRQRFEGRATLLQVAEQGGFKAATIFLRSLLLSHLRLLSGGFVPTACGKSHARNVFALRRLRRETSRLQAQAVAQSSVIEQPLSPLRSQIGLGLC